MELIDQFNLTLQLLLAGVLTALVGSQRERSGHSAGLRTHMIVGMGACLFTGVSIHGFPGGDPARVAAQIVSGIGFLGAGVIFTRRNEPKNLTTAASIWTTAGLGLAVGAGAWFVAITATLMVWFTLQVLGPLSTYLEEQAVKKRTLESDET
jgi:putative Mg2+ transporter-C (MgtC) family protein